MLFRLAVVAGSLGLIASHVLTAQSSTPAFDSTSVTVAKAARAAEPARQALARAGVDINEAANGVFLPAVRNYVGQVANHLTLHTQAYYRAVNDALQHVEVRQDALDILEHIRNGLLSGKFP